MTSNEIRIKAQLQTGFTIDSATALMWISDAVRYIARHFPSCAPITTADVTIFEEGETVQTSNELVRFEKITRQGERTPIAPPYFECYPTGEITFWHQGSYTVTYKYVPEIPVNADEDLPLPDRFLEPIKYYVAARIRGRMVGQNDSEAQNYDSLFHSYLNDADSSFKSAANRYKRMPARY